MGWTLGPHKTLANGVPTVSLHQVECLGDLQGPKFRVGELAGDPVELKNGEIVECPWLVGCVCISMLHFYPTWGR